MQQSLPWLVRCLAAAAISFTMAQRGLKRASLSYSGALAAGVVGFLSMAASWRTGWALIVFYATASRITRVGQEVKRKLEDEFKEGGRRDAVQVLCNSAIGVLGSLAFAWAAQAERLPAHWWSQEAPLDPNVSPLSCTAAAFVIACVVAPLLALPAHAEPGKPFHTVHRFFSACNGDTWSSELGILSKQPPVMVTNPCKRAPPGTNGAVSTTGTLAAAAGGAVVGLSWLLATCLLAGGLHSVWTEAWVLPLATSCGVVGSLLDSLAGATLQASVLQKVTSRIVSATRARALGWAENPDAFKLVAGVDVLSNEGVNFVTTAATAVLAGLAVACFTGAL